MPKIKTITFKNFKFFHGEVKLELDRNNLLLYGENGSGKSSIYWGLYTFLHSVFKDEANVKKYFDSENSENLINRFSDDDSSIAIEFENSSHSRFTRQISFDTIDTKDGNEIKEAVNTSDFINYKLLSKIYDFSNREDLDLFPVYEKEVLMFLNFRKKFIKRDGREGTINANDWWEYINSGMNPHPKMREAEYKDFQNVVTDFNTELRYLIRNTIQSANELLETEFNIPVKLYLNYKSCVFNDFKPGTKSRSWKLKPPKLIITTHYLHDDLEYGKQRIEKPHTFLNEAKLSAIALSLRLAILKEKYIASAPNILVVDDLLLSLDMSNRNTVLDIILTQCSKYQILFMTHEKMLFEMAKSKIKYLKQNNWKYIEMYAQNSTIPKPLIYESESYLGKAKKYLEDHEYEIAGNFLRKEAESFLKDILPNKYKLNEEGKVKALGNLISSAIEFAKHNNLRISSFEKLDSYRAFVLNPSSHDSYDVPKFYSELKSCIRTLSALRRTKIRRDIIKKGTEVGFVLKCTEGIKWSYVIKLGENLHLIKERGKEAILTKGNINYRIYKGDDLLPPNGGEVGEWNHKFTTIKAIYDYAYEKSDKDTDENYLNEIAFIEGGDMLNKIIS